MKPSFQIERLEDRILLAGNVTAIQSGSQLIINGDSDDNELVVGNDGGAGTIEVLGLGGTSVNGAGSDAFAGITHIVFRGRGGDDSIEVEFIDIAGNLTIQLNNGDGGFQDASVFSSSIGGNLAISSDGATDSRALVEDNDIGGSAKIATGAGDDEIGVVDSTIDGQLVISAGQGDNDVFLGGFEGGLAVGTNLVVVDAAGDLEMLADNVGVGGNLNINAGQGENDIVLEDVDVGNRLRVETGDGDDYVHLCDVDVVSTSVVALRGGDDTLEVGDSGFGGVAQFSGGPHGIGDEYVDLGGNTGSDPIITRFETFGFGEGCGLVIVG